ncbi:MAG: glycosyltransferase family 4 protein [Promethearchaeota archaeon]
MERAYLIAEALSRYFNVVLLGPAFQQYGGRIWEPLENANLQIIPLPASDLPELVEVFEQVSDRLAADAIIACKPRLPSLLLGHLLKSKLNRPLFVDIDDYELAFTASGTPLGLEDVADAPKKERCVPYSDTWTRFCDNYLDGVDGFFVSNETLQRRYGGILVPHARDEQLFDPDLYDRSALRGALGLAEEDKVVLFAGTPRADNGVLATLEAVLAISDPRVKMLVVGRPEESSLEKKMCQLGRDRLILLGNRPIDELPCYVACSDVVCLLRDPASAIAQWHLPATIAEAFAFGLSVLATPVAPLKPLIKAGVIAGTSETTLREDLERHLLQEARNAAKSRRQRREYFLAHMSYAAIGTAMATAIHKSLERKQFTTPNPMTPKIIKLADSLPSRVAQPSRQETSNRGLDIVMVWKQYDLCLYGRRIDMLIKYLAARTEVRRVVALDRPASYEYFCQWQRTHAAHQDRSMYVEWLRKSWGLHDSEKVRYSNFTYSRRERPDRLAVWCWPRLDEYLDFLAESFTRNDIDPAQASFIVYPRNQHISEIVEHFRPGRLVADVVDDQRAWPNVDEGTRHALTEHYREVLGMSDFVITNCEPVKQAMSEFHQDIRVLPNGIDTYLDEDYPMSSRFREFNALPHPRIGFVGNLEQKIDIDLLRSLALKRPQWQLVLVGSVHANPKVLELAELPNVYFPGVVPYEEAKHWIRNFDVAILPHLRTELTRHMNPLKFYVYLGLGVPVVSTPIENLGELSRYVTIAPDAGAFIDGIENELNRHESEINLDLNRDVYNNTWEQRINTLLAWLTEPITRKLYS